VTCVVSPYIEPARNSFVAKDLRHAFVVVPALVVDTGCKDVGVVTEAIEIPMVTDVRQIMRGNVEVTVVVVVAAQEVRRVEGGAMESIPLKTSGWRRAMLSAWYPPKLVPMAARFCVWLP